MAQSPKKVPTNASSIGESIRANGLLLAGFGVAMALALGLTKTLTDGPIARSEKRIQFEAVQQVLPQQFKGRELYNNDPYEDVKIVQAPWGESKVYRARLGGTGTALAMQVNAANGYSGSIKLLLGLTDKGQIISLRAVKNGHRETPGLGDKIEVRKSPWILQFTKRIQRGNETWSVNKDGGDITTMTSATITSRAVVDATNQALAYFRDNRTMLFASNPQTQEPN